MAIHKRNVYSPLHIGDTIHYALKLYQKYFVDILIYAMINIALYMLFILMWQLRISYKALWLLDILKIVIFRLIPFVSTAVLMIYINEHEHRRNITLRNMVKKINTVLIPLVLAVLLVTIINVVGLMVFIIPGILFIVMFSQTYFFALYENHLNPFAALSASEQLTRHNRFRILCIFSLFSICYLITHSFFKAALPGYILPLTDTILSAFLFILNYAVWRGLRS